LYPLTKEQRELFLSHNIDVGIDLLLDTSDKNSAIDYIINVYCAALWIELEANYFTLKDDIDIFNLIKKVYLSSKPILSFDALLGKETLSMKNEDMITIRDRFSSFCNKIENEVPWIKNHILKGSAVDSLHSLILEVHDEVETDLMFGPIDETDLNYNFDDDFFDNDDSSYLHNSDSKADNLSKEIIMKLKNRKKH